MSEREGKFLVQGLNMRYKGFWTSAAQDKKKGSGIGILIEDKWEKHVGAVKRYSEYTIEVRMYFKQLELILLGVYIPPNDKTISKKVQQRIVETVANRKKQTQIIVFGDFNHTVDNVLDRQHPQTTNYKRLPLFNWLKKQDFVDSYRSLHPTREAYT